MERIPVVRRKSTPGWIWALLLVALLAVLYFLFFRGEEVGDSDLTVGADVRGHLVISSSGDRFVNS